MGTPSPTPDPSPDEPRGTPGPRRTFRRAQKLTHAREFKAVFDHRMRKGSGPLGVFLKPNDLAKPRLGLSIGRAVGGATVRNRLKRLIREAFRLNQAAIPTREGGSYDLVVSAKPHEPMTLAEYAALLLDLIAHAARENARRQSRTENRQENRAENRKEP